MILLNGLGPAAKERGDIAGLKPGEACENVTVTDSGYTAHVGITRIHMEEDAGKMIHIGGDEGRIAGATHSLVDYNRAGTPLIELVTEPDLRTPEEARLFMQKLRQIYLAIGISDCSHVRFVSGRSLAGAERRHGSGRERNGEKI